MPRLNISNIGKGNVNRGHTDEREICEFLLEELGNRNTNANPKTKDSQPGYDRAVVALYERDRHKEQSSCYKILETQ